MNARLVVLSLAFLLSAAPSYAEIAATTPSRESNFRADERPPLDERILYELLAGTALGFGGAYGGLLLSFTIHGFSWDGPSWWYAPVCGVLGSAIGVYAAGHIGNQTGSFLATLAGSAIGIWAWGFGAPVCATVAFNLTRRYKSPPSSESAFLNLHDGKVRMGMPPISSRASRDDGAALWAVEVVEVRF